MTTDERSLFSERAPRPRARRDDAAPPGAEAPGGAPAPAESPGPEPPRDATEVLRDVRQGVRATVDEWLSERSHTISLAVAQVVEDALTRLQAAHAARVREISSQYEERLAALERERTEAVRGAVRRRRARVRAVERDLRERIERLERSLTEASLEATERLREVERQASERRLESERVLRQQLLEKDEEIARLRRGGTSGDSAFDSLADQLRSRRPGTGEH